MKREARPADLTASLQGSMGLLQRGHLAAARQSLIGILKRYPNSVQALQLLGAVTCELGQYGTAVEHLKRAVALEPRSASAHFNLGKALRLAGKAGDALASLASAVQYAPEMPQVHLEYGNTLLELERDDAALASYFRALELDSRLASAHLNSGVVLLKKDEFEAANAAFDRFLRLEPAALDGLFGKAMCQQLLCDWHEYDARISHLIDLARKGQSCRGTALFLSTVCDDNAVLRLGASREIAAAPRSLNALPKRRQRTRDRRTRVAYVSADFRRHPVGHLAAGLFEAHDRSHFEIVGISFGPNDGSEMRLRLEKAFDHFEDLHGKSSELIAERIYEIDVDIAVDLMGHTKHAKPEIFAYRPAPIQVNFLGFPGTSGTKATDYMVVDPYIATAEVRRYASEKLVVLPDCYQPNDDKRVISGTPQTRREEGLPERGFVFCCFNQMRKITPHIFDRWMRILNAVDGSVLWLLTTSPVGMENLRSAARARGVAPERLIFAQPKPHGQHLARIPLADLFVDTYPYGAHTTASDALWVGCPVVTLAGSSFASRVCGSLLHTMRVPELVTTSLEAYEALAVRLAQQPAELSALKARLAKNRLTSPLFNTRLFCRSIERAYERMISLSMAGKQPIEIDLREVS